MSDADPNLRRLALPLALCAGLLAAPFLLRHSSGAHPARRPAVTRVASGADGRAHQVRASRSAVAPLTADQLAALAAATGGSDMVSAAAVSQAVPTSAAASPASGVATTTTAAPSTTTTTDPPTTTTTRPPTTTTTRPPTTTTTRPPTTTTTRPTTTTTSGSHSETGSASWYQAPTGTCAHPTLPFGTVVTVTNLANGASTQCRVEDRGPYSGGRIIDLSEGTFSQIASTSEGVIQVRIEW